jgi:hypothetical protein
LNYQPKELSKNEIKQVLVVPLSDLLAREKDVNKISVDMYFLLGGKTVACPSEWVEDHKFKSLGLDISSQSGIEMPYEYRPVEDFDPQTTPFKFQWDDLEGKVDTVKVLLNESYRVDLETSSAAVIALIQAEIMWEVMKDPDFKLKNQYDNGTLGQKVQQLISKKGPDNHAEFVQYQKRLIASSVSPIEVMAYVLGKENMGKVIRGK